MKKASEIFDQILSDFKNAQPEGDTYISIYGSWEKIVGTDLADHSKLIEIEGETLVVEVDHPSWANLLHMNSKKIVYKIEKAFPELEISRIRVTIS